MSPGGTRLGETYPSREEFAALGVLGRRLDRDEFAGHGICSSAPYLNGLVLIPASNSFHPNANGYRYGYLATLTTVTG